MHMIIKKPPAAGCLAKDFSALTRRVVHNVIPFIRSPITGEALGEFIIEKLMPPYQDAKERLIEQLRTKGDLANPEKVEDACREVVARREKKGTTAGALGEVSEGMHHTACIIKAGAIALEPDHPTIGNSARGRGMASGRGGRTAKHKTKAQRSKADGVVSYRQQCKSNESQEWHDARVLEIDTLKKHGAVKSIRSDDPKVLQFLKEGGQVVDCMMTGKQKFDANHKKTKKKNRCVMVEHQASADGESRSPTRIDECVKSALDIGRER